MPRSVWWTSPAAGRRSNAIVARVGAAVLTRELERAQAEPLPTLQSYSLLMGAIALLHRLSAHDFDRAREMLETLVERAPRQAAPRAWLAKWHVMRVQQGWSENYKREAQLASDCTKRALDNNPQCSLALTIDGLVHATLKKELDIASQRYELALHINPNESLAGLSLEDGVDSVGSPRERANCCIRCHARPPGG